MKLLTKMLKMISYQENLNREGFILKETEDDRDKSDQNKGQKSGEGKSTEAGQGDKKKKDAAGGRVSRKEQGMGDRSGSAPEDKKINKASGSQDGNGTPGRGGEAGKPAGDGRAKDAASQKNGVGDSEGEKEGNNKGGKSKEGKNKEGKSKKEKNKEGKSREEINKDWDSKNSRAGAEKKESGGDKTSRRVMKRPLRPSELKKGGSRERQGGPVKVSPDEHIKSSLELNEENIRELYCMPENKDVVIRDFILGTIHPVKCFAVFMDGMTDKTIQDFIFQSLMLFTGEKSSSGHKLVDYVKEHLIPGNQVSVHTTYREVLDAVNYGETAIFFEGCASAITLETKGFEKRGVERPVIEQIIRGPQEGFGETLRVNTSLIRKRLRNENLVTEITQVGKCNRNDVAIMYLRNLANPDLVAEVKRRIESIRTDIIFESGILEQFIEDSPYNLSPQALATERPDRVVAGLAEGRVCIIVDGNPFVLMVPTTMYELLHTGEENYLRWQYGTFLRYIRTLAFYMAFLLPGFYLAVVLFHHEMIPTELLLAIAGNRERVPFPSVIEVLLMELSFELIREGSLRLPGLIGSTIGIVGALILGQAAVQANIVSPILVILVGVTGLANFAIPNYSLSFALRIYRFMYIFLGATLGFFGITIGLAVQILLTANLKSFGVPYLAPSGPRTVPGTDVVTRLPVFFNERRPDYLNPRDITRQPEISRGWVKEKGVGGDDQSG